MKKIFFAVVFSALFFQVRMASALTFKITYDASVTNLTNAAEVENAFGTAAQAFSDLFTNVATINIQVYWGPVGPFSGGIGLGRSQFQLVGSSYSAITNALSLHQASSVDSTTVASLPVVDPTGGGSWFVPLPEARVLGIYPSSNSVVDGQVGFATNVNYTFDPNNRSVPGRYDFIGVAQHELTEILGRANAGLDSGGLGYLPYDLFRFTNSGVRSLTIASATNAYFSVDNGVTALKFFYSNHLSGDIQDWKSSAIPDSFDAFVSSGHINPMSTVDIMSLDVLGYNGLSLQPPRLYAVKTNENIQVRFVNSPGVTFTVVASTNLAVRETNWVVLGTPTESPAGQFTFTDGATNAFKFYSVRSP
jgi:hypothetical protein